METAMGPPKGAMFLWQTKSENIHQFTFVRINSPVDCQKFRKGEGYSHADDEQGVEHGQCHQDLFECHLRDQIKIVNFDKAATNKTAKSFVNFYANFYKKTKINIINLTSLILK